METNFWIIIYAVVVAVLAVITAFVYFGGRVRFGSPLNLSLLQIKVPRAKGDEKNREAFLNEINLSEQLISALGALNDPFAFEVSVHNESEQIFFYLAVPRQRLEFAMRQIQGLVPDAKVDIVPDYTIFAPNSASAGMELALRESFVLPIRGYKEAQIDTFSPILSTLSKLDEIGQGASIQFVMVPADKSVKKSIVSTIEDLKKGVSFRKILKSYRTGIAGEVWEIFKSLFNIFAQSKQEKIESAKPFIDDEGVKALTMKASKQLFSVNGRIVASAPTQDQADDILLAIAGSFSQFSAPVRNEIKAIKPSSRNLRNLIYKYSFREYDKKRAIILNTEEIASLFHLPTSSSDIPRISWLSAKEAPPPENLPSEGVVLGKSIFRGDSRLVKMTDDDRRRHLYIIGQTGTGKSFMMLNMVIQDLKAGKGLCVIDPHGELVENILQRMPKERVEDVIVFDPGDLIRPIGLNMLEYDFAKPEQKTFIVNEFQSIFNRLFTKESMGPMFEQYMRNALQLLMEDYKNEPATIMEIPRIFIDDGYRERKLKRISNLSVIDFWEKQAAKASGEWSLANMAPYITSKFDNFINNDYMRPIIGQTKSAVNFRRAMDEGKIILVNLSKGKIGDINSSLLGMIVTGKILMSALSRVDIEEKARKDFYLYIDEFQNYTTDSISTILSEARKYRLNLTLAHQYIAQLSDEIASSVFGNVGSMVAFRVGAPDTEKLMKQFSPEFSDKDMISIENKNCMAKLLINGHPSKPFSMETAWVESGNSQVGEKLKELSRLTYGKPIMEIERDINIRLRS